MRREHSAQQSYIDWLKSLGCVLWLPFAEAGDLNDRISGNDLVQTDVSGYFIWDIGIDMMYYHSPAVNSLTTHKLLTLWDNTTFVNNEYTVLSDFKRKSATGFAMFFMLGAGHNIPTGASLMYNGSTRMGNWHDYQEHKSAYYLGTSSRKIYQDGSLYNTYSPVVTYLPSNWGSYDYIVGNPDYSIGLTDVYNREIYIRNIMIFNRELSLSEIREIQGYE